MKFIEYKLHQSDKRDLRQYVDYRVHELFGLVGTKGNTIKEDIDHAIREAMMDAAMFMFDHDRDDLASIKITGGPDDLAMTLFVLNNRIQGIKGRTRAGLQADFYGSRDYILFVQQAIEIISQKYPTYVQAILHLSYERIRQYIVDNLGSENKAFAMETLESYSQTFLYVGIHADLMAS